ncbi:hypothetical protein SLA2020_066740 [Shorea laevis]
MDLCLLLASSPLKNKTKLWSAPWTGLIAVNRMITRARLLTTSSYHKGSMRPREGQDDYQGSDCSNSSFSGYHKDGKGIGTCKKG